ncbi:MAG: hypothetical protein EBT53_08305 [Betaproteobacteria bacterium]|nr:hypothetical protein [Candidatus Fonsibacter lacus]
MVDSAAQLSASDQGCLAITGSHGGLSAARYAWVAKPWLVVFNDAGVGKDQAGIAGLAQLAQQGVAAATVSHTSARIGDASSTLADGVISYVNAPAKLLGLQPGVPLAVWINTQDTPTA